MTTPTENWPKPYLLQIHEQAVKHGFIWIEPITEADAASLKSRLYRIRRRSDASMAAFILPEYHLVMIGVWEMLPDPAGNGLLPARNEQGSILGRLPVLFNKKADGTDLPRITVPSGAEVEAYCPPPQLAAPAPSEPIDIESLDLTIKPAEIDSFVAGLMAKSSKRKDGQS